MSDHLKLIVVLVVKFKQFERIVNLDNIYNKTTT